MEVKLYDTGGSTRTLSIIASQSRKFDPEYIPDLFEKTLDSGHESIQEFIDFTFLLKGISRVTLAQLTRHRMASYNVMSFRHVPPKTAVIPEGIKSMHGRIEFEEGGYCEWNVDPSGWFSVVWDYKGGKKIPLEDLRYGFPMGLATNLFMKINGRSLRNFLKLRLDSHAQWEIREMAGLMYDEVEEVCPTLLKGLEK